MDRFTIVFTDGAAKGNPGPGGWGAIVVTPEGLVTELGGGSPHTTNNKMELSGAIAALEQVADHPGPVAIYTDSTYVIQGITQWVWAWRQRNWKTAQGGDVLNRELWERLSRLVGARGSKSVDWRWVRGHVGTPGNERVDEIAVAFALQEPPPLYRGPLSGYELDILKVPDDTAAPKRSASSGSGGRSKAAAHSYLSVVDGVPMRHATWAECEGRVKGRSGARFKKSTSAADEAAILRDWGVVLAVTLAMALAVVACGRSNRQTQSPAAAASQTTSAADIAPSDPRIQYFHDQLVVNGEDLQSDFGGDLLTLGMNPRDLQQDDPRHAYDTVFAKVRTLDDAAVRREMMRTFFNITDAP